MLSEVRGGFMKEVKFAFWVEIWQFQRREKNTRKSVREYTQEMLLKEAKRSYYRLFFCKDGGLSNWWTLKTEMKVLVLGIGKTQSVFNLKSEMKKIVF